MRCAWLPLVLVVGALVASACDFRAFLLDTNAIPGQREGVARECCECLASQISPDPDERCFEATGEPALLADAGPSTCLCGGANAATCTTRLMGGGDIEILGACSTPDGPCGNECEDVLAYP